ncbi:MAG: hypothetical protein Q9202_001165 [Teloschistes flavicans]
MADPLTAKVSICPSPNQGLSYCCDNGRAPSVCCNNATELLQGEAPFSSITAGPESRTVGTTLSTGASFSVVTTTLTHDTTSAKPSSYTSMLALNSTVSPDPGASTTNATSQANHHSRLGAGLGGGLGGFAGVSIISIGLFYLWRRKKADKEEKRSGPHELEPSYDPIHQPNAMLFPAELSHEDSKASISPFELDSRPIVEKPAGPYETSSQEEPLSRKPTIPTKSEKRRSPYLQQEHSAQEDEMLVSPLVSPLNSDHSNGEASRRAQGTFRPDSVGSPSGPWHDRF